MASASYETRFLYLRRRGYRPKNLSRVIIIVFVLWIGPCLSSRLWVESFSTSKDGSIFGRRRPTTLWAQERPFPIDDLSIEYCPGCRWMNKAFWMATEVFSKYNCDNQEIQRISVIPAASGTFKVTASMEDDSISLWDRTLDGGFPPVDLVEFFERLEDCLETGGTGDDGSVVYYLEPRDSQIVIGFDRTKDLFKAVYYGQELLTTFAGELQGVILEPIEEGFCIVLKNSLESHTLVEGSYPQPKNLKQLVRDALVPDKDLGHSDRSNDTKDKADPSPVDSVGDCIPCNNNNNNDDTDETDDFGVMDDDDAEEARRFFGVM